MDSVIFYDGYVVMVNDILLVGVVCFCNDFVMKKFI